MAVAVYQDLIEFDLTHTMCALVCIDPCTSIDADGSNFKM